MLVITLITPLFQWGTPSETFGSLNDTGDISQSNSSVLPPNLSYHLKSETTGPLPRRLAHQRASLQTQDGVDHCRPRLVGEEGRGLGIRHVCVVKDRRCHRAPEEMPRTPDTPRVTRSPTVS